ncbi:F-box/LRR-repeat protein, putative [Pediculus humanus corporis]|uniref:F-box/LRR-repeat protein, putative n=1 Tax=Pediculus humanus subsp. corporis TaxID=121224 RepID=E0VAN7_PEDHC|nr:F-box/LRR-repeat protein, putative [Pediculus humanus corporis]EEB10443.1 F-box/LRR-repeat protein, putative [Pediculus humanus corporis]
MSSMSAQGVVERASAELTKRINGLGLRSSKHHNKEHGTKTSVMERVTNVFCGGGNNSSNISSSTTSDVLEKPSRLLYAAKGKITNLNNGTGNSPNLNRKNRFRTPLNYLTWEQLMMDERFLAKFFGYFTPFERRTLAQVCVRWRDHLYRSPRYWSGLHPVIRCKELQNTIQADRARLYNSLLRRGFHSVSLLGASDEDALDLVLSFPLASKHIHSISLRCSSVSDRGLEALLDHLQALFELELAGCNEITEAGLWACLTPRIVALTLTDCINIADEAMGAVAQLLPSLYEFSLQAYHVSDAALGYFSPKQSNSLSILRLHSCWEVTNHGMDNIVHSLPNLTVLSLSGCSKITDEGVEAIAENLHKLRSLDLSWCPRITDAALECIACDLNQLEELTLDRCIHITDLGIGYISTMLSLSALYLRWCTLVKDFGLQHLCGMRNLQILSLAGCPLLTSSGLSSLIQLRHLQELELTNCPGASPELFDYLREHLPKCLVIE